VSPLDEELGGHSAELVGRTCNEHPRHAFSPLFSKDAAKALHDTGARSGGFTPPFDLVEAALRRHVAR
jgi:hypothetical protein